MIKKLLIILSILSYGALIEAAGSQDMLNKCTPTKAFTNNYEPTIFNKSNNLLRKTGADPLFRVLHFRIDFVSRLRRRVLRPSSLETGIDQPGFAGDCHAVGAFEIDAITEGHAIQRIHFGRQQSGGGTIENAAAIHKVGGVGGVLPQRLLRDKRRQRVKPDAHAIAAGSKNGEVGPMDVVLVVTAGRTGRVVGDTKIGQHLIVVVHIHVERKPPLPEVAEAGDAVGLFLRLRQCGHKQGRQNGDDGDNNQKFNQRKSAFCFHNGKRFAEIDFARLRLVAFS